MDETRYVRFDRHQNNVKEIIDADHVNELQKSSESVQQEVFRQKDYDFLDKALFVLDNHNVMNGLWIDTFTDPEKIDTLRTSEQLMYDVEESSIIFKPELTSVYQGTIYSEIYENPEESALNKIILMADTYTPQGTEIKIEVSNNNADWFEVTPSKSDPFTIPTTGNHLQLRAKMTRLNGEGETPHLFAWALLYYDPNLNIIELPDGSDIIIGKPDDKWDGSIDLFHNQLKGIGPDDHHPQEHSHDGKDGSGIISHQVLIDIGENDHHDKNHRHGADGVDYVNLTTDVIGTLSPDHLSYMVWTGKPGETGLYFDPNTDDRLVYVKSPDDEVYLFYDMETERLSHTITIVQGVAVLERMIFGDYLNSKGTIDIVLKGTTKEHYDASDELILAEIAKISAPSLVLGFVITDMGTTDSAHLTWLPNTALDLVGYNIYMSIDNGVTYQKRNINPITQTDYVASGLTPGVMYYFYITAVDIDGYESDPSMKKSIEISNTDIIAPAKVVNFESINVAGVQQLIWQPSQALDLDRYVIYRSLSGADETFYEFAIVAPIETVYIDTTIESGEDYFYYIVAVDTAGNKSIPSNVTMIMGQ